MRKEVEEVSIKLMEEIDSRRAAGESVSKACQAVGLNERSYYRWRKRVSEPAAKAGEVRSVQVPRTGKAIGPAADKDERDAAAERIIEAAIASFSAVGFKATTNRAIAKSAGVSHGLVRYHFRSKHLLWLTAIERSLSAFFEHLSGSLTNISSDRCRAADRLAVIISEFVRFIAKHPEIPQMLTREPIQGSSHLKIAIDTHLRQHYEMVKALLLQGQRDGDIRMGDTDQLYYLLANSSQVYTTPYEYKRLTGKDVFDPQEVENRVSLLLDIFIIK